jgi:hypothetical protein
LWHYRFLGNLRLRLLFHRDSGITILIGVFIVTESQLFLLLNDRLGLDFGWLRFFLDRDASIAVFVRVIIRVFREQIVFLWSWFLLSFLDWSRLFDLWLESIFIRIIVV